MVKEYLGWNESYNDISVNQKRVKRNVDETLKPNQWIGCYSHDGGDSRGENYFYTIDYVKKDVEDFLKEFETQ